MYIYGGYLYVTAFGKEDNTGKAKKYLLEPRLGFIGSGSVCAGEHDNNSYSR